MRARAQQIWSFSNERTQTRVVPLESFAFSFLQLVADPPTGAVGNISSSKVVVLWAVKWMIICAKKIFFFGYIFFSFIIWINNYLPRYAMIRRGLSAGCFSIERSTTNGSEARAGWCRGCLDVAPAEMREKNFFGIESFNWNFTPAITARAGWQTGHWGSPLALRASRKATLSLFRNSTRLVFVSSRIFNKIL